MNAPPGFPVSHKIQPGIPHAPNVVAASRRIVSYSSGGPPEPLNCPAPTHPPPLLKFRNRAGNFTRILPTDTTSAGFPLPGTAVSYKLYVRLNTGDEAGGEAETVVRLV